jgi:RHS repeat-associated protein
VETFYYHADQQGNIRSLTDAFGSVTDAYNYDAYGSQVLEAGSLGTHNSLGYASQFTDGSGLVYMRARYYDPATQQFLTRDPLAAATGHPYVYAGANPINAVDPTGTAPWWLAMLGVAALGVGSSIAFDVGADYTFDNSNFDFWTSVGTSASDPGTWLAAIPSPGIARKFTTFGSKFGGIEKKAASKTAYMLSAFEIDNPPIKLGSAGGPGVGKEFSWDVFRQNPKRLCVFCRMPGANAIDHVIPKTRGGNNTIENAQLACTHCNASKGNRGAYPMSPPRGYVGPWPPPWWP